MTANQAWAPPGLNSAPAMPGTTSNRFGSSDSISQPTLKASRTSGSLTRRGPCVPGSAVDMQSTSIEGVKQVAEIPLAELSVPAIMNAIAA